MFDVAQNVQLAGRLLKVLYPKLTVMPGVENTALLFFNDVAKIPILHQIMYAHKIIYNIFGSGTYHKPHSVLKSKSQQFHNKNIDVFSGNYTRMAGNFIGMHRDLRMRKVLQSTIFFAEFICIPTKNCLTKQLGILMTISSGEGAMYLSRLFFLV